MLCADGEVRRYAGRLLPLKGLDGSLAAIVAIHLQTSDADSRLFVVGWTPRFMRTAGDPLDGDAHEPDHTVRVSLRLRPE